MRKSIKRGTNIPLHLDKPPITSSQDWLDDFKSYLEANLLDGDKIQSGQMLASTEVFVVVEEYITHRMDLEIRRAFERGKSHGYSIAQLDKPLESPKGRAE